jgi:hypothetical protein
VDGANPHPGNARPPTIANADLNYQEQSYGATDSDYDSASVNVPPPTRSPVDPLVRQNTVAASGLERIAEIRPACAKITQVHAHVHDAFECYELL